jgi:hypothetical protein
MQQIILETLYGKKGIDELIKLELKDIPEQMEQVTQAILEYKTKSDLDIVNEITVSSEYLAEQLGIYTLGKEMTIQELINVFHLSLMENSQLSKIEAIYLATDIIKYCDGIIYDIRKLFVYSHYDLDSETQMALLYKQFLPPLIEPPLDWINNNEGGFHSLTESVILGPYFNSHSEKQALDVLNMLQKIEWKLDKDILQYEEEPNKEFTNLDSEEQFYALKDKSKLVYKEYANKPFYFVWQFDKRGRQYSSGFHINLQASGYKKAILNFSKKEIISGEL